MSIDKTSEKFREVLSSVNASTELEGSSLRKRRDGIATEKKKTVTIEMTEEQVQALVKENATM